MPVNPKATCVSSSSMFFLQYRLAVSVKEKTAKRNFKSIKRFLKGHSTDSTCEFQFTRHKEYCSACDNSCPLFEKITPMMSEWCHQGYLGLGSRLQIFNRKPVWRWGIWKRGRESLMKDTIELHYGKWRIQDVFGPWQILRTKSQDILASASLVLTILGLICCLRDPQLNGSEIQKCSSTPLTHIDSHAEIFPHLYTVSIKTK